MQYRGPAKVTISAAPVIVKEGKAPITAKFTEPGTYVLRATANDGELSTASDITITVLPGTA
jgi:hypothetical protein